MIANDDFGLAGFSSMLSALPRAIELDHAVALRIADPIGEDGRAGGLLRGRCCSWVDSE